MHLSGSYTEKGRNLATKVNAGLTSLTITRVTAGSGVTEKSDAELAETQQTLSVGPAVIREGVARLPVTLTETLAPKDYTLTELGVYATDPEEGEILYQFFKMSEPRAITASDGETYRFYLLQVIGAEGITVVYAPTGLLIDEDLEPLRASLALKPDALKNYTVLHVAKTGSDNTGNGSAAKPYLTIQKAIDSLPRILLERAIITVHEGTYSENVKVIGFFGNEQLQLSAAEGETVSVSTICAANCLGASLEISGFTVTGVNTASSYTWSVWANCCSEVIFRNITCTVEAAQQTVGSFWLYDVGIAKIRDTVISNKQIALDVLSSAVYLNSTVTGSANTVGIRCGSSWGNCGGYVQKGGAALGGEEQKGYGGQIW